MGTTIFTVKNKDSIKKYCPILLKNGLYLCKSSAFYEWLNKPVNILSLVIYKENEQFLGIAIKMKRNKNNWPYVTAGVYVMPKHRREGIGRKLLNVLSKNHFCSVTSGIKCSRNFYVTCKKHNKNIRFVD